MIKTYDEYINANHETGSILSAQGFSAMAKGLPQVAVNELVLTETGALGIVNALGEDTTEILMIDRSGASKGEPLVAVNELLSVPVGDALLGRTVSPLGVILDGGEPLGETEMRPLEQDAPPIYMRDRINQQLITGVMLSDLLVPLGRGQREVVMGDAKSGKTSFLLQILMHVKDENMIGIYVGIGKTRAELRRISTLLTENTGFPIVVVAASASDSTTLQYLAPYAGMTMAEHFRDKGQEVFLVLDDLGNHARAHREISLLNNRLPGRDSYPGDIFYTHSRLLERAGKVKGQDGQGHTITLMPIIETIGGDLTGYVQTNLISMSDGHTLFDLETFYKGIRPAINIGLSVSRVGKQTQTKLQKYVASELRTMLAQYDDAKNFVRFGAELTDTTKALFLKGTIFEELIKQDLSTYLRREQQLTIMLALLDGFFDPYPINQILEVRYFLLETLANPKHEPLVKALAESADESVRKPLQEALYAELKQRIQAQKPATEDPQTVKSPDSQPPSDSAQPNQEAKGSPSANSDQASGMQDAKQKPEEAGKKEKT